MGLRTMTEIDYDTVYETFLSITEVEFYNLPQTDEGRYKLLSSARIKYNIDNGFKLQQDDILEVFKGDILSEELGFLLANYVKLQVLVNIRDGFVSEYGMHTKEIGVIHYDSQKKGKENNVKEQEQVIKSLRMKMFLEYEDGEEE